MPETAPVTFALAITGASGAPYALRLLAILLQQRYRVQLMISGPGRMVLATEAGINLPAKPKAAKATLVSHFECDAALLQVYANDDWFAPLASGSSAPRAMVICPCTSGTLGAIANGHSRSLIERSAEVVLKERRQLIVVLRETPYSIITIENMLRLARAGALILPSNPGFYHQPRTLADVVDFVVARILDHLGVAFELLPRWGREAAPTGTTPNGETDSSAARDP